MVLVVSLVEYFSKYPNNTPTFVGSNATLIALVFAAYLAYVFQQRGKFVDELRGWWNDIVEAKSVFFVYCDKSGATEDDYFEGFYKLSTSMDTLRLIYCNVGRSAENPKGYYPFEQVRDMIDIARSIKPDNSKVPTMRDRARVKDAINIVFQSLRHAIQSEASASVPDDPTLFESPYRAKYLLEIKNQVGIDVVAVRELNKRADYFSSREKN